MTAEIGIKVLLEDAARQGLYNINSELGRMSTLGRAAGVGLGGMNSVLLGIFAGTAVAFAGFALLVKGAIDNAVKFQTILIQMGRAGNLTGAQMTALGQVLMDVGGHSIFSIEELGQAFVVLLQRGITAKDIMTGVGQQAVYLAEATGMKAVPAAQLLASTMVAFNIPASKAAQTVDLLQFAIEHGIGPSDTLASSIARLGSIASVLHISLADTIPALDVLTRASGSYATATTQLYYYLNQVKFGTSTYRDEIQKLGISFYDAKGNFIGLNQSLVLLYNTLKDKTPQEAAAVLGALFNIRSSQGIAILMEQMKQLAGLTDTLSKSHDNLGTAMMRAQQAEQSAAGLWRAFRTNLQDVLTLMGGPFLGAIQPMLANLNNLAIQLRTFAAQNPQTAAAFLALGLAISGLALIIMVAVSPFGPFIAIILATVAAITLGALAAQKFIPIWGQWLDWLSGKSEMDAQRIKAANLSIAQGVDAAKLQVGFKNIESLQANHVRLMELIAKTSSPVMVAIYNGMDAQILQELGKARDQQIAIERDRDAKQLALHKTLAGNMVIAERTLQSDLRAANDTAVWVADLTRKRNALYQVLLQTNDKQKKAEIQHQIDMLNAQIAGGNAQIYQDQKQADIQRARLAKYHSDQLANQQNFIQRFLGAAGQAFNSWWAMTVSDLSQMTSYWGGWFSNLGVMTQRSLAIVGSSFSNFGALVRSIVTGFWNALVGLWNNGFGGMRGATVGGTNNILGIFAGIPGSIFSRLSPLGNLGGWFANWINNAASVVWGWIGAIVAPFQWAANQIAGLLPHSPPKWGPLVGYEKWLPNMIKTMAKGATDAAPQLQMAFYGATQGIASASSSVSPSSGGGGAQPTVIYLDGKVIYDNTMNRMRGDMAMNGLWRAFR